MVKVSVLYRHESRYEEFIGEEVTHSNEGNLFLIYNENGHLAHIIPFDAVASIDIEYDIDQEETTLHKIIDRPGCFAPHSYTLNNYWDKNKE
jgi:hypothetical protein